ncbi:hypothetical protein [Shimia sp.]|uniref:hypothetical protein n=1 Tax=Shimia sp. TaxID=1954381 RepID=UPI0032976922
MPETSKVFSYQTDGLSYTVVVYEENGEFFADISVSEGAMDVNAVYFGDDDFSGKSESLDGPLNMNGARLDGDKVQWDDAAQLSDPGLGPEGTDKETYVETGDTLTVQLDISSLDDIDVFGIRATSTTTPEGSIKGVSDDPEEPEEPEEPLIEKVFFQVNDDDEPTNGVFVVDEEREGYGHSLPEGTDPTFENYLQYFEEEIADEDYNVGTLTKITFYEFGDEGYPVELFNIEAPDGGYESAEDVLAAYDEAIADGVLDGVSTSEDGGLELMAALSLGETADDDDVAEDEPVEDVEVELV